MSLLLRSKELQSKSLNSVELFMLNFTTTCFRNVGLYVYRLKMIKIWHIENIIFFSTCYCKINKKFVF